MRAQWRLQCFKSTRC